MLAIGIVRENNYWNKLRNCSFSMTCSWLFSTCFFVLCLKWILWLCDLYLLQYYHFTWIKYLESAICTNFTNLHFFIYINKAYYYYEYWTISVEILIIFFLYIKIIMKTSGVLFPFPLFSTLKGYSFIVLALRKKRNLSP